MHVTWQPQKETLSPTENICISPSKFLYPRDLKVPSNTHTTTLFCPKISMSNAVCQKYQYVLLHPLTFAVCKPARSFSCSDLQSSSQQKIRHVDWESKTDHSSLTASQITHIFFLCQTEHYRLRWVIMSKRFRVQSTVFLWSSLSQVNAYYMQQCIL